MLLAAALALTAPASAAPAVTAAGELRVELVGDRIDDLYIETPDADPELYFNMSRARVRLNTRFSEQISTRISLDARSMHTATTYTTEGLDAVAVDDFASGFEFRVMDAWGLWSTPNAGDFTAGLMFHCFGVRCTYDSSDGFYFGGVDTFMSMSQRVGIIDFRVVGLKWERDFGDRVGVMAMASNAASAAEREQVVGKDATVRIDVWPVAERLRVTGSAIVGPGGDPGDAYDPTRVAWSGSALARFWKLRALVDVLGQRRGEINGLGWHANLGGDVGLSGSLDRLELMARVERWEPDLETDDDSSYTTAAAANLYWASPDSSRVMTGLLYEVILPEDLNLAIEHQATAQARFTF